MFPAQTPDCLNGRLNEVWRTLCLHSTVPSLNRFHCGPWSLSDRRSEGITDTGCVVETKCSVVLNVCVEGRTGSGVDYKNGLQCRQTSFRVPDRTRSFNTSERSLDICPKTNYLRNYRPGLTSGTDSQWGPSMCSSLTDPSPF